MVLVDQHRRSRDHRKPCPEREPARRGLCRFGESQNAERRHCNVNRRHQVIGAVDREQPCEDLTVGGLRGHAARKTQLGRKEKEAGRGDHEDGKRLQPQPLQPSLAQEERRGSNDQEQRGIRPDPDRGESDPELPGKVKGDLAPTQRRDPAREVENEDIRQHVEAGQTAIALPRPSAARSSSVFIGRNHGRLIVAIHNSSSA